MEAPRPWCCFSKAKNNRRSSTDQGHHHRTSGSSLTSWEKVWVKECKMNSLKTTSFYAHAVSMEIKPSLEAEVLLLYIYGSLTSSRKSLKVVFIREELQNRGCKQGVALWHILITINKGMKHWNFDCFNSFQKQYFSFWCKLFYNKRKHGRIFFWRSCLLYCALHLTANQIIKNNILISSIWWKHQRRHDPDYHGHSCFWDPPRTRFGAPDVSRDKTERPSWRTRAR